MESVFLKLFSMGLFWFLLLITFDIVNSYDGSSNGSKTLTLDKAVFMVSKDNAARNSRTLVQPRFDCKINLSCISVHVVQPKCWNGFLKLTGSRYLKVSLQVLQRQTLDFKNSTLAIYWLWGSEQSFGKEIRRCRNSSMCRIPALAIGSSWSKKHSLDILLNLNNGAFIGLVSVSTDFRLMKKNLPSNSASSNPIKQSNSHLNRNKKLKSLKNIKLERKLNAKERNKIHKSNFVALKRNARRRKREVNEAQDLAVLMQGENTVDREKIAELIASDFNSGGFKDPVVAPKGSNWGRKKGTNFGNLVRNSEKEPDQLTQISTDLIKLRQQIKDKEVKVAETAQEVHTAAVKHEGNIVKGGDILETLKAKTKAEDRLEELMDSLQSMKTKYKIISRGSKTDKPRKIRSLIALSPAWEEWGSWSKCSVDCGDGGFSVRRRECETLPDLGCPGPGFDMRSCSTIKKCEAQFHDWGEWGPCSVTCGRGMRARSRVCVTGDEYMKCKGPSTMLEKCRAPLCKPTAIPMPVPEPENAAAAVAPPVAYVMGPPAVAGGQAVPPYYLQPNLYGQSAVNPAGAVPVAMVAGGATGSVILQHPGAPEPKHIGMEESLSKATVVETGGQEGPYVSTHYDRPEPSVLKTKSETGDEDQTVTAVTLLFVVLFLLCVLLLIIAFCVFFYQRWKESNTVKKLKQVKPFYKQDGGDDDDMDKRPLKGKVKPVLRAQDANVQKDMQDKKDVDNGKNGYMEKRKLKSSLNKSKKKINEQEPIEYYREPTDYYALPEENLSKEIDRGRYNSIRKPSLRKNKNSYDRNNVSEKNKEKSEKYYNTPEDIPTTWSSSKNRSKDSSERDTAIFKISQNKAMDDKGKDSSKIGSRESAKSSLNESLDDMPKEIGSSNNASKGSPSTERDNKSTKSSRLSAKSSQKESMDDAQRGSDRSRVTRISLSANSSQNESKEISSLARERNSTSAESISESMNDNQSDIGSSRIGKGESLARDKGTMSAKSSPESINDIQSGMDSSIINKIESLAKEKDTISAKNSSNESMKDSPAKVKEPAKDSRNEADDDMQSRKENIAENRPDDSSIVKIETENAESTDNDLIKLPKVSNEDIDEPNDQSEPDENDGKTKMKAKTRKKKKTKNVPGSSGIADDVEHNGTASNVLSEDIQWQQAATKYFTVGPEKRTAGNHANNLLPRPDDHFSDSLKLKIDPHLEGEFPQNLLTVPKQGTLKINLQTEGKVPQTLFTPPQPVYPLPKESHLESFLHDDPLQMNKNLESKLEVLSSHLSLTPAFPFIPISHTSSELTAPKILPINELNKFNFDLIGHTVGKSEIFHEMLHKLDKLNKSYKGKGLITKPIKHSRKILHQYRKSYPKRCNLTNQEHLVETLTDDISSMSVTSKPLVLSSGGSKEYPESSCNISSSWPISSLSSPYNETLEVLLDESCKQESWGKNKRSKSRTKAKISKDMGELDDKKQPKKYFFSHTGRPLTYFKKPKQEGPPKRFSSSNSSIGLMQRKSNSQSSSTSWLSTLLSESDRKLNDIDKDIDALLKDQCNIRDRNDHIFLSKVERDDGIQGCHCDKNQCQDSYKKKKEDILKLFQTTHSSDTQFMYRQETQSSSCPQQISNFDEKHGSYSPLQSRLTTKRLNKSPMSTKYNGLNTGNSHFSQVLSAAQTPQDCNDDSSVSLDSYHMPLSGTSQNKLTYSAEISVPTDVLFSNSTNVLDDIWQAEKMKVLKDPVNVTYSVTNDTYMASGHTLGKTQEATWTLDKGANKKLGSHGNTNADSQGSKNMKHDSRNKVNTKEISTQVRKNPNEQRIDSRNNVNTKEISTQVRKNPNEQIIYCKCKERKNHSELVTAHLAVDGQANTLTSSLKNNVQMIIRSPEGATNKQKSLQVDNKQYAISVLGKSYGQGDTIPQQIKEEQQLVQVSLKLNEERYEEVLDKQLQNFVDSTNQISTKDSTNLHIERNSNNDPNRKKCYIFQKLETSQGPEILPSEANSESNKPIEKISKKSIGRLGTSKEKHEDWQQLDRPASREIHHKTSGANDALFCHASSQNSYKSFPESSRTHEGLTDEVKWNSAWSNSVSADGQQHSTSPRKPKYGTYTKTYITDPKNNEQEVCDSITSLFSTPVSQTSWKTARTYDSLYKSPCNSNDVYGNYKIPCAWERTFSPNSTDSFNNSATSEHSAKINKHTDSNKGVQIAESSLDKNKEALPTLKGPQPKYDHFSDVSYTTNEGSLILTKTNTTSTDFSENHTPSLSSTEKNKHVSKLCNDMFNFLETVSKSATKKSNLSLVNRELHVASNNSVCHIVSKESVSSAITHPIASKYPLDNKTSYIISNNRETETQHACYTQNQGQSKQRFTTENVNTINQHTDSRTSSASHMLTQFVSVNRELNATTINLKTNSTCSGLSQLSTQYKSNREVNAANFNLQTNSLCSSVSQMSTQYISDNREICIATQPNTQKQLNQPFSASSSDSIDRCKFSKINPAPSDPKEKHSSVISKLDKTFILGQEESQSWTTSEADMTYTLPMSAFVSEENSSPVNTTHTECRPGYTAGQSPQKSRKSKGNKVGKTPRNDITFCFNKNMDTKDCESSGIEQIDSLQNFKSESSAIVSYENKIDDVDHEKVNACITRHYELPQSIENNKCLVSAGRETEAKTNMHTKTEVSEDLTAKMATIVHKEHQEIHVGNHEVFHNESCCNRNNTGHNINTFTARFDQTTAFYKRAIQGSPLLDRKTDIMNTSTDAKSFTEHCETLNSPVPILNTKQVQIDLKATLKHVESHSLPSTDFKATLQHIESHNLVTTDLKATLQHIESHNLPSTDVTNSNLTYSVPFNDKESFKPAAKLPITEIDSGTQCEHARDCINQNINIMKIPHPAYSIYILKKVRSIDEESIARDKVLEALNNRGCHYETVGSQLIPNKAAGSSVASEDMQMTNAGDTVKHNVNYEPELFQLSEKSHVEKTSERNTRNSRKSNILLTEASRKENQIESQSYSGIEGNFELKENKCSSEVRKDKTCHSTDIQGAVLNKLKNKHRKIDSFIFSLGSDLTVSVHNVVRTDVDAQISSCKDDSLKLSSNYALSPSHVLMPELSESVSFSSSSEQKLVLEPIASQIHASPEGSYLSPCVLHFCVDGKQAGSRRTTNSTTDFYDNDHSTQGVTNWSPLINYDAYDSTDSEYSHTEYMKTVLPDFKTSTQNPSSHAGISSHISSLNPGLSNSEQSCKSKNSSNKRIHLIDKQSHAGRSLELIHDFSENSHCHSSEGIPSLARQETYKPSSPSCEVVHSPAGQSGSKLQSLLDVRVHSHINIDNCQPKNLSYRLHSCAKKQSCKSQESSCNRIHSFSEKESYKLHGSVNDIIHSFTEKESCNFQNSYSRIQPHVEMEISDIQPLVDEKNQRCHYAHLEMTHQPYLKQTPSGKSYFSWKNSYGKSNKTGSSSYRGSISDVPHTNDKLSHRSTSFMDGIDRGQSHKSPLYAVNASSPNIKQALNQPAWKGSSPVTNTDVISEVSNRSFNKDEPKLMMYNFRCCHKVGSCVSGKKCGSLFEDKEHVTSEIVSEGPCADVNSEILNRSSNKDEPELMMYNFCHEVNSCVSGKKFSSIVEDSNCVVSEDNFADGTLVLGADGLPSYKSPNQGNCFIKHAAETVAIDVTVKATSCKMNIPERSFVTKLEEHSVETNIFSRNITDYLSPIKPERGIIHTPSNTRESDTSNAFYQKANRLIVKSHGHKKVIHHVLKALKKNYKINEVNNERSLVYENNSFSKTNKDNHIEKDSFDVENMRAASSWCFHHVSDYPSVSDVLSVQHPGKEDVKEASCKCDKTSKAFHSLGNEQSITEDEPSLHNKLPRKSHRRTNLPKESTRKTHSSNVTLSQIGRDSAGTHESDQEILEFLQDSSGYHGPETNMKGLNSEDCESNMAHSGANYLYLLSRPNRSYTSTSISDQTSSCCWQSDMSKSSDSSHLDSSWNPGTSNDKTSSNPGSLKSSSGHEVHKSAQVTSLTSISRHGLLGRLPGHKMSSFFTEL